MWPPFGWGWSVRGNCSTAPPPALPAGPPRYVIPGSHLLDPAYALVVNPLFPFPRPPLAFETQTRAVGTGLIRGCAPCPPCPPVVNPLFPASRIYGRRR